MAATGELAARRAAGGRGHRAPGVGGAPPSAPRKLAAAVSAEGGRPHDAPQPAAERVDAEEALARAEAAIVAHVAALPSLAGRELRALGADLVAGAAADIARARATRSARLSDDPFPGTPP